MLALLGGNVARCALRSQQWKSEQSLFTSALSVCPLNAKVRLCLTHFYLVHVFISYTILTHLTQRKSAVFCHQKWHMYFYFGLLNDLKQQ